MNNFNQIRLLENVMKVAARAYWKNEVHCGSEWTSIFMTLECQHCSHHEVCKARVEFSLLIAAEKNAGKM